MTTKTRTNPKAPTKRRLIAIDCETNGLFGPNLRILTLAMVELRNGIAFSSKLWSFHPGRVPMDPGALAVNGLTPEILDGANSFGEHVDEVLEWLSAPRGTRVTLVGHKVAFDARQLAGEFARLGLELPRFELIDTATLADAAGVRPGGQSLDALLEATGVANTAPHTALGDTLATGQAALVLMKRATTRGTDLPALLDRLATPYKGVEAQPSRSKPTIKLSPAHAKAHLMDLADGRRRRRALDVCVAEECRILAARMEDGLLDEVHARQVVEWALDYLTNYELSQQVVGQLLVGLGRALRRTEDPDFVLTIYRDRLATLLPLFDPCGHKLVSRCYSCQEHSGPCELTLILRDCVDGFLDSSSAAGARPDHARVEQFLPGYDPRVNRNRGRPAEGFYGELRRNGHLDAAGYGAYCVAEVRRTEGGRAWAHAVLNKAWRDGCRTPQLTELLASMVVVDGLVDGAVPSDPKDPLRAALGYIAECQAAYPGQHGQIFARLSKRATRLTAQLDAEPRAPRDPDKALNRREPHRTLLAEPLGNVAIPVKFERKRRGRPPKVRASTTVRKNNKTSRKSSGSVDDGGRH
jgi:DNA polymerase III epsilon subunit-like protein